MNPYNVLMSLLLTSKCSLLFCVIFTLSISFNSVQAGSLPQPIQKETTFSEEKETLKSQCEVRKEKRQAKRQKRKALRRSLRAKNWPLGKVIALWLGAGAVGLGLGFIAVAGFTAPLWGLVGVIAAGIIFLLLLVLVVTESEESFWRSMLWAVTAIIFGSAFLTVFSPETLEVIFFVLELL